MVAGSNSIDDPLRRAPIHTDIKLEIARSFWGVDAQQILNTKSVSYLDLYFKYYTEQNDLALHDRGRFASVKTHRDIICVADILKLGLSKDATRDRLRSENSASGLDVSDEKLDASMNLAIRLLLMLRVGRIQNSFSGQRELSWDNGTLQDFISSQFNTGQAMGQEKVRLDEVFVARNLGRIARIRIAWTDNLGDHLRMQEHDTQVAIFHHISFLETMKSSSLFPSGLVEETIRSMALLLPTSHAKTQKWYKKEASMNNLDLDAAKCGLLRPEDRHIDAFEFWRDRLVILKHVFDEAEPNSWSQWWYDRRKGVQRYPFLVAAVALALTVVFGLIQCLEGALQVYKAYHPSS